MGLQCGGMTAGGVGGVGADLVSLPRHAALVSHLCISGADHAHRCVKTLDRSPQNYNQNPFRHDRLLLSPARLMNMLM